MATRSGSVDPGAILYLLRERDLTVEELDRGFEDESGIAALGGLDDPLGFAVYTYRIAQAAAAMATALGGLDALAFSGGVGENRGARPSSDWACSATSASKWPPPERT
jgi:acetate kinase